MANDPTKFQINYSRFIGMRKATNQNQPYIFEPNHLVVLIVEHRPTMLTIVGILFFDD